MESCLLQLSVRIQNVSAHHRDLYPQNEDDKLGDVDVCGGRGSILLRFANVVVILS